MVTKCVQRARKLEITVIIKINVIVKRNKNAMIKNATEGHIFLLENNNILSLFGIDLCEKYLDRAGLTYRVNLTNIFTPVCS